MKLLKGRKKRLLAVDFADLKRKEKFFCRKSLILFLVGCRISLLGYGKKCHFKDFAG